MSTPFHPDLRLARFLPRAAVGPRSLRLVRGLTGRFGQGDPAVEVVPLGDEVAVRVHRPSNAPARTRRPAMLWIHGGGYVIGSPGQDDAGNRRFAEELGIVVAAVRYRLAPEHPFPTPLEDCYTALRWLAEQPDIDPGRIAIGGASAGGGLAAALALLARDRGEVRPVLQLLSYPMIDDRTTGRDDLDARSLRLWSPNSNRFGWRSYLGLDHVTEVPALAAAARATDLGGLPPAWIGVGTRDLFHDEDVAYAARLLEAGVPCTLHEVPGAYHGFDGVEARSPVARAFLAARTAALDEALNGTPAGA